MRRATITIPDDLERAIEKYRRDLKVPPTLAAVVQTALREYLAERGYFGGVEDGPDGEEDEFVPSEGGKPRGLADAPRPRGGEGNPVSKAVIEDRR